MATQVEFQPFSYIFVHLKNLGSKLTEKGLSHVHIVFILKD